MKIIGICGSPRKGNTELLLTEALNAAKEAGAETELILLRDKRIEHCDGCDECIEGGKHIGKCHKEDDMEEICKKLEEADGIILASPNYYSNMSGLMKDFVDRSLVFYGPRGENLKGKVGGTIGVGGDGGKPAIDALKVFFDYGIKIVGTVDASALKAGDVANDKKALEATVALGKKIAKGG